MPSELDEEFAFASGRPGNSRARPGAFRPSARMLPLDFLTFFNVANRDQAFALTVQRIKDVLTGVIATRVSPKHGLKLSQHGSNTPPVLASPGSLTLVGPGGEVTIITGPHIPRRGRTWWVQTTDPALSGLTSAGDVWVK